MTVDLRVRRATAADVPTLVALMSAFYAESDYPLPAEAATRAFAALLADDRLGGAWVGEIGGEAVGHVVLTVSFSMEYGGLRGFVDDLFVRKEARRHGVGAALLAAVRDACTARGVRALLVEVGPDNAAARSLYARAGYTDSGHLLLAMALAPPVHAT